MAEMKKYLDQKGIEYLWSKLSMEDYPNNETLMAVINAIDETKANKEDIVSADWNASEGEPGHILNKPFGTETVTIEPIYDGNLEAAKEIAYIDIGCHYTKVSSEIFSVEEILGSTYTRVWGNDIVSIPVTEENILLIEKNISIKSDQTPQPDIFIVTEEDELFTVGTWFLDWVGADHVYVQSWSCLSSYETTNINKVPIEYLPEGIGYKAIEKIELIYDGNSTGKETSNIFGAFMVKISPQYFSISDLNGARLKYSQEARDFIIVLNNNTNLLDFAEPGSDYSIPVVLGSGAPVMISVPFDTNVAGVNVTAGTWFIALDFWYIKSLKIDIEKINKIPIEYLPEEVTKECEIEVISDETIDFICGRTSGWQENDNIITDENNSVLLFTNY